GGKRSELRAVGLHPGEDDAKARAIRPISLLDRAQELQTRDELFPSGGNTDLLVGLRRCSVDRGGHGGDPVANQGFRRRIRESQEVRGKPEVRHAVPARDIENYPKSPLNQPLSSASIIIPTGY